MFTISICLIWLSVSVCLTSSIRVCHTFSAYDSPSSEECYDNPSRNITEIIEHWGFTTENHYITTEDGYILLLERAYSNISKGQPIIIVHGLAMNGLGFVFREKESLVYLLGSLGYDLWILNMRGVTYSREHTNLTTEDRRYWYYSIHEIGIYDIRSTIKYVNEKTNQKAIYIGYSMGTTTFYIYSSTFPEEAKSYIKGMVGLGPSINLKGTRSVLPLTTYVWPPLKALIYILFHGEMIPGLSKLIEPLMKTSWGMYFAQTVIGFAVGFDYQQMDAISYPLLPRWVDSAAVEVWTHYLQIYLSRVFRNYDHGIVKNLQVYGQAFPPRYNLTKIPVSVALFVGPNDVLATVPNAEQLYSELAVSSKCGYHSMGLQQWNHLDFIVAKDIEKYLYDPLLEKIIQFDNDKCNP